MINLEKGFKRLAIVAMPFYFILLAYIVGKYVFSNIEWPTVPDFLWRFVPIFFIFNPLTFFYLCKFIVDGFRDDD